MTTTNVCSSNIHSRYTSNLLVYLLRILLEQTLVLSCHFLYDYQITNRGLLQIFSCVLHSLYHIISHSYSTFLLFLGCAASQGRNFVVVLSSFLVVLFLTFHIRFFKFNSHQITKDTQRSEQHMSSLMDKNHSAAVRYSPVVAAAAPPPSHCYFTRLNLRKMGPFQFYFPVFLGINRHPKQKEILNSCEGFLRAALTGHSHPSPFFWTKCLYLKC